MENHTSVFYIRPTVSETGASGNGYFCLCVIKLFLAVLNMVQWWINSKYPCKYRCNMMCAMATQATASNDPSAPLPQAAATPSPEMSTEMTSSRLICQLLPPLHPHWHRLLLWKSNIIPLALNANEDRLPRRQLCQGGKTKHFSGESGKGSFLSSSSSKSSPRSFIARGGIRSKT